MKTGCLRLIEENQGKILKICRALCMEAVGLATISIRI
jgi:hypothetical protein